VISGLNGDEQSLPVFARFDVEAPIGAPKVSAAVPVLGEAFAHDSFAESAKFTLPSIFHDNLRWIYRSRAEALTQFHGEFTAAAKDS
jgi:hypothetical protein